VEEVEIDEHLVEPVAAVDESRVRVDNLATAADAAPRRGTRGSAATST
jgi:hypothetical protein